MHNITSPRTDDSAIEQEIKDKGLTAPRVTPEDIENNIASQYFFTADQGIAKAMEGRRAFCWEESLGRLTFCVLGLQNGFTVTGQSACVSAENFDASIGRKIARQNAVQQMWALMGYELASKQLANGTASF